MTRANVGGKKSPLHTPPRFTTRFTSLSLFFRPGHLNNRGNDKEEGFMNEDLKYFVGKVRRASLTRSKPGAHVEIFQI